MPHIQVGKPMSCTSTTMKMPSAAGNIWLASMPRPKATFWPKGTLWVAVGALAAMGSFIRLGLWTIRRLPDLCHGEGVLAPLEGHEHRLRRSQVDPRLKGHGLVGHQAQAEAPP